LFKVIPVTRRITGDSQAGYYIGRGNINDISSGARRYEYIKNIKLILAAIKELIPLPD